MSASGSQSQAMPTLASRHLPRRVRALLEGILEFTSDELERGIVATLNEFEQQLFKFAEQARSNMVQTRWLESQRLIKRTRHDLVPRFLISLEAELANLREPQNKHSFMQGRGHGISELSLVNELEMDETSFLIEMASRAELRNSLPLYLLGQRFGVLAGRPAFDPETLPIGPQALCRMMRTASDCLELSDDHRLMFLRAFDRQVMPMYGSLVEAVNTFLCKNGVLPHLQYVPLRARPASQPAAEAAPAAAPAPPQPGNSGGGGGYGGGGHGGGHATESIGLSLAPLPENRSARAQLHASDGPVTSEGLRGDGSGAGMPATATGSPNDGWGAGPSSGPGSSGPAAGANAENTGEENFQLMRQLLSGRRQLLGKLGSDRGRDTGPTHVATPSALQDILGSLQAKAVTPVMDKGKPVMRSVGHLKQDMLAMLRQAAPDQSAPALAEEDGDAIDLVGMLYDSILKDVKPNSPASMLLSKLQVPLLRVALQDKGFFTKQQHPARLMLNTIAETGAYWLSDDEADEDLVHKMNAVVDRTVREFDGDMGLFSNLLEDLSSHLQTVTRKAEVAERRHVEAARGKEKLSHARERAAAAMESLLKQQNLPRFTQTLLSQAWTDVMALTALRHGEDSDVWKQQLGFAERLIQIARTPADELAALGEANAGLQAEIEQALSQVGYQGDEANAIAQRLVHPLSGNEDDAASRTELTMRLKARARLGEDLKTKKEKKVPLTAAEQARYEQLKQTPFGSWFEFRTNQQGDMVRRRLSWFSTVTGHVLFVNHRGQKVEDHTLESLARMMVQGQVRVIQEEKGSLIDRAWTTVMNALRSFAGQPAPSPVP
ncbi:MAG TPA: DUF1631 domain-containing protein [Arenimonas sp.]|uniref:DUF1631 domain-containing protein n=1 Tax=Arenimonas sp. TaxID=1872635 RepID=UPI002BD017D0|nr:DUF1631 domain-containing protein [Arenimonas sp.]HMB57980.1 DUF1631 domain-containing protein [Arenimonas sp.]